MSDTNDIVGRAREVIAQEVAGMNRVAEQLGDGFKAAIERIEATLAHGGKIVITGVGKNRHIAGKMAATLTSTGSPSTVLETEQAMHGDIGVLDRRDVLIALSYSGESEELLNVLGVVRKSEVPIIALTAKDSNALGHQADHVIGIEVDEEACPFNMAPTVSTTATLAVGDAIAMVLMDRRNFTAEDYARLHPGGAIGRTLLLKVEDFMRTGDRLARVHGDDSLSDALLAMTRARAGSVGIVDDDERLLGIFTDGDLRRCLAEDVKVLERPASEVMVKDPITARLGQSAVEILRIYAEHEVDDLLVLDEDRRLVGLVDIQQLPKLKIF